MGNMPIEPNYALVLFNRRRISVVLLKQLDLGILNVMALAKIVFGKLNHFERCHKS